jgi:hypothetical protein
VVIASFIVFTFIRFSHVFETSGVPNFLKRFCVKTLSVNPNTTWDFQALLLTPAGLLCPACTP